MAAAETRTAAGRRKQIVPIEKNVSGRPHK